ncbi:MAG: hypothetical protein C5B49_07890 [Bdellovibrio sp.]|nr:MAG: hypothetical protein C5B49_07890 [Bdellovibrio sp.]
MRAVATLTFNTFLEMVRDRTVAILFFGALILILLSFFLGSLSLDEQRRVLIHLGFGTIHLSCLVIVLSKGPFQLSREIERQTCLMVLARPISRTQFLFGHLLAVLLLIAANLLVQGLMLFALLGFSVDPERYLIILAGIFLEMSILTTFIFWAVQWVRPVIAFLSGLTLFLVGNWLDEMKFFAERTRDEDFRALANGIRWFLPNLFLLNFRNEDFLVNGHALVEFQISLTHFLFWIGFLSCCAALAFRRRNLV